MNIGAAYYPLGTQKSRSRLLELLRVLDYEKLRPIIGTKDDPIIPAFWRNPTTSGDEWQSTNKSHVPERLASAIDVLENCPREDISWTTIVTSACFTLNDAYKAAEKDAERLESIFRARHPDGILAITVEVDLKLAKDVQDSLFRDARWRQGIRLDQIVYVIHFHGLAYAPAVIPSQMQRSITHTPTGRLSKFYGGSNQVRCLPLYDRSDEDELDESDQKKCLSYSSKYNYRPPSKSSMLEAAPQWFLLSHMIFSNPKLTRIVGLRKGIRVKCDICSSIHNQSESCGCSCNSKTHNTAGMSSIINALIHRLRVDSSLIPVPNINHRLYLYLNSFVATRSKVTINWQEKKKHHPVSNTDQLTPIPVFHGKMPAGP
jgi:hypothetical protein